MAIWWGKGSDPQPQIASRSRAMTTIRRFPVLVSTGEPTVPRANFFTSSELACPESFRGRTDGSKDVKGEFRDEFQEASHAGWRHLSPDGD